MFGNLGSRNLFKVRELNYFSSAANKAVGNPSKAHSKAMSRGSGSSSGSSTTRKSVVKDRKHWTTTYQDLTGLKLKKETEIHGKPWHSMSLSEMEGAVKKTSSRKTTFEEFTGQELGASLPPTPKETPSGISYWGNTLTPSTPTPTLKEEMEAKAKATQEFREKWHGIKENGVVISEPTATRTDALQALLTSNNEHFGTDTRNLKEYLTERDYDISAIIAGETTVPDDIFRPEKKTTYREMSKQLDVKLDRISNYELAKGKNAVQRNVSYGGIKGSEYIQLKEEVEILQDHLQNTSTQVLKAKDENTIRDVVAKTYGVADSDYGVYETVQNVSRTTKGTTPEKEISTPLYTTSFLPLILIFAAGVLGVYLVMRKLK